MRSSISRLVEVGLAGAALVLMANGASALDTDCPADTKPLWLIMGDGADDAGANVFQTIVTCFNADKAPSTMECQFFHGTTGVLQGSASVGSVAVGAIGRCSTNPDPNAVGGGVSAATPNHAPGVVRICSDSKKLLCEGISSMVYTGAPATRMRRNLRVYSAKGKTKGD